MSVRGSVVVRRRLPAPVAEVFGWWTQPDLIAQWMTPVGNVSASVDLRVGGSLRVVMEGDGMVIEHTGEFVEVTVPRRLVFTWSSPYTGPRPSLVTVDFEPHRHVLKRGIALVAQAGCHGDALLAGKRRAPKRDRRHRQVRRAD